MNYNTLWLHYNVAEMIPLLFNSFSTADYK
jgi:hypothetical protein